MSFLNHVCALCRIADQYCIWDVHKIAPLLLRSVLIPLVNALISSRLDCCNSLLTNADLPKLQMVQNSLARPIRRSPKYHIGPILHSLLWLPIEQTIHALHPTQLPWLLVISHITPSHYHLVIADTTMALGIENRLCFGNEAHKLWPKVDIQHDFFYDCV